MIATSVAEFIENDLRRVLAYSLINQVGFMVCGIGIGTHLAINGAVSHAFNDTATTEIYTLSDTLSLHDALPISVVAVISRECQKPFF